MTTVIPANTIPCITVRQPWAMFALGDESKDIENRSTCVHPVPIKGQQGRFTCPVELEVL